MKKIRILPLILVACVGIAATGCSKNTETSTEVYGGSGSTTEITTVSAADAESNRVEITGDFTITTEVTDGYTVSGNVYTITEAGEYTLTGLLEEGQVVVDAAEDAEVTLILNGVSITCTTGSPIYVASADSVKIKSEEDSFNEIIDNRSAKTDSDEDTEDEDTTSGNGAIYAKTDLSLTGKGTLVVTANYNNGVHTTKDLTIKNVTLKVVAVNTALKGKDSVTIESGELTLVAQGGDGIKTSDSDISDKGNQRGTVTIESGNIDIYAACDGIDAAYNVEITGDCNLNIFTDTYSDYTGDVVASSSDDFYLVVSTSDYSDSYDYYAYYYDSDSDEGVWKQATYSTTVSNGRSASYYALVVSAPSGYENVAFYIFESGATPSTTSYVATTEGDSVNSSMNGYLISEISSTTMEGDWVSLSTGSSSSGSSSKSVYSAKGIKAANEVIIDAGTISIEANDDGIHANNETALESGEDALGNITINGGTIVITAADDGMHADNQVTINGGYIDVETSYEGIEGNLIEINDGSIYVYATDDGLNACSGNTTPCITVNGGYLEVGTPNGDTDAIDSNGYYKQTGGFVLVKGGASTGSMAGSVDVDNSITVTGGCIIALGGICETPEDSVNAYCSSSISTSAGTYTVTDEDGTEIASFTISASYTGFWMASDNLVTGTTYTLSKDGSSVTSWEQESGTMGATSSGMGGMGGGNMGGGMGGRH